MKLSKEIFGNKTKYFQTVKLMRNKNQKKIINLV